MWFPLRGGGTTNRCHEPTPISADPREDTGRAAGSALGPNYERVGGALVDFSEARVVTGSGRRVTAALDHAGTVVTRLSDSDLAVAYALEIDTADACLPDSIDDFGSNEIAEDAAAWLAGDTYALCPEGDGDGRTLYSQPTTSIDVASSPA